MEARRNFVGVTRLIILPHTRTYELSTYNRTLTIGSHRILSAVLQLQPLVAPIPNWFKGGMAILVHVAKAKSCSSASEVPEQVSFYSTHPSPIVQGGVD